MENFINKTKQPFTTFTNDIIQGRTIFKNANQKLTYMYLYSFANCSKIFPSISSISTAVCCSPRTAMRLIQELEEIGLISVKRTKGKSNLYILNDYQDVTSDKISPVTEFHETSDKDSSLPVTNLHTKNNNLKTINKNNIIVNKEQVNKEDIINKLISEYRQKGLSKDLCLRVLSEVEQNPNVENFGAYLRTCLENTLYKKMLKNGEIEFKISNVSIERSEFFSSLYNWLDE